MKRNKNGFTLVEIIIVMAIIAILTLIMIPTFGRILNQSDDAKSSTSAVSIYNATIQTLVREDGAPIINLNDTSSSFHKNIIANADLPNDEKIEFKTYNASTKADLPSLSSYSAKPKIWLVYLPEDKSDNTYNFNEAVVIFTPSEYNLNMYIDGIAS